jgi:hypothetical protein
VAIWYILWLVGVFLHVLYEEKSGNPGLNSSHGEGRRNLEPENVLQSGASAAAAGEVGADHPREGRLRLLPGGALHRGTEAARSAAHDAQTPPTQKSAAILFQPATDWRFPVTQLPQPGKLSGQFQPFPAALFPHTAAHWIPATTDSPARAHQSSQLTS